MFRRIQKLRPPLCRGLSTPTLPYSYSKLRAYPFGVTPEEAQQLMAMWASPICGRRKMIGSALARTLPFLNLDFIRPHRFAATYFPAWKIDAELEIDVSLKGQQRRSTVQIQDSYLPGSDLPVLSAARLISDEWPGKAVPFSEDLLNQHGLDVQCVPFTISPFSLFEVLENTPDGSAIGDLCFDPSSMKTEIFSAMPVLVPVYLGQYYINENDVSLGSVTFFTPGNTEGAIMAENFVSKLPELERTAFLASARLPVVQWNIDKEVLMLSPVADDRVNVYLSPFKSQQSNTAEWLEEALDSSQNLQKLASLGYLDSDSDPRIREMSDEEGQALDKYFATSDRVLALRRLREGLSRSTPVFVFGEKSGLTKEEVAQKATLQLTTQLEELERERKEAKPSWWLEWELSSNREK